LKRVNLSYSVDLEEVPQKVLELLDEVNLKINKIADSFTEIRMILGPSPDGRPADIFAATEAIKKMRVLLAKEDVRLEECSSILSGYLSILMENGDENLPEGDNDDN
tara:strand:- start:6046 stop:6366 length:321 start_codon:yes stop_codon:yes gene_type:complete